jgi:hypothetical protein
VNTGVIRQADEQGMGVILMAEAEVPGTCSVNIVLGGAPRPRLVQMLERNKRLAPFVSRTPIWTGRRSKGA